MTADDKCIRRYNWKLYPNAAQAAILEQQSVMCAELWNALLQRREDVYRRERKTLSYFDQSKECTVLRNALPDWKLLSAMTLHQTAQLLDRAFKAFFQRAKRGDGASSGYPRYKRTRDGTGIPLASPGTSGWNLTHTGGSNWKAKMFGVGVVRARGALPFGPDDYELRTATVMKRAGSWFISVSVRIDAHGREHGKGEAKLAFDLVDRCADVSIDDKPAMPTPDEALLCRELEDRKARLASDCDSRHVRFSYRWKAKKRQIAKLSARIARRRCNAWQCWTTDLVRQSRSIDVAIPKLEIETGKGDAKHWGAAVKTVAAVNKRILAFAPAAAVAMLEYKAAEAEIPINVRTIDNPKMAIGHDIAATAKAVRKVKREIKRVREAA